MRTLWIAGGLLLAACFAACGEDLPMAEQPQQAESAGQEPQADSAQPGSSAQAESRPTSAAAATVVQSETQEQQSGPAQEDQAEPSVESEAGAAEEDDSVDVEDPAPSDLTEVPALVVGDAEMRVRPGLAWPVIMRLSAGEEVVVLNAAGGWYQIAFGDGESGWVFASALDLGAVEHRNILQQQAALIIAEWQGAEYGVMGQSADATEVRLMHVVDYESVMVNARKDEVTLLSEDITLDDLPVLIGDETVVFPGDDLRAGQGKILPRADEWMWLPWGWLLAHNEEFIWQWRPESDEHEFIRRPPGPARLSPDGRHLAVIEYEDYEAGDYTFRDLHIIPLSGSPPWSLRELMSTSVNGSVVESWLVRTPNHIQWSANGRSVLLTHQLRHHALSIAAVFLHPSGDAMLLTLGGTHGCHVNPRGFWWPPISLSSAEETIVAAGTYCDESAGHHTGYLVYDEDGVFDRFVPLPDLEAEHRRDLELLRSAKHGERLGDELEFHWSPSRERALVVDYAIEGLWLYDADTHLVQQVHLDRALFSIAPPNSSFANWDVYWFEDSWVAVLPRWGYDWTLGKHLIDLESAEGISFEGAALSRWSCLRSGSWRPDGERFPITFAAYVGWGPDDEGRWIDGLAVTNDALAQLQVNRTDGSLAGLVRIPTWKWSAPLHVGQWSPSGDWLAIGGHRERSRCVFSS